ncbi:MAG: Gfo/Idh/MocA family protein [Gammaproteobacteria bacterium]
MRKLRCAVVGVGYFGKFHALKLSTMGNVDFVGVADAHEPRLKAVCDQLNVPGFSDYRDLVDKVEAVSIAVPTSLHFNIARYFIENGVHVLIEKPITATVEEAETLIELARKSNVQIQVGMLEQFNPTVQQLRKVLHRPLFIECHRIAPFNPRCKDVNVILDMMIHDIDLLQQIVNSPIKHIDASGTPVLTDDLDIVNARIRFMNNCVANVTASRISYQSDRKLRIFQPDSYVTADLKNYKMAVHRKGTGEMFPGVPNIENTVESFAENDPLRMEIKSFVASILENKPVVVSGEMGRDALVAAMNINDIVYEQLSLINASLKQEIKKDENVSVD